MIVTVPSFALHYDADYYPEPETFNPERYNTTTRLSQPQLIFNLIYAFEIRWSNENKANMNPNAYLPFGMGPRNCVGMRFAMEEIKIALCTIVKNFRFFPTDETPVRSLSFNHCNRIVIYFASC